ncbi:MAG: Gfo/Idh/MocA family oxidoreductase [Planctomyces sp.]|nr:Gfo/Idh/MocA family oxidoreductase [Planctomyces sp.]
MTYNRRRFLQHAAFSAAAASSLSRTEWVVAEEEPQSKSPNEKIGVACIGIGGRGGDHISNFIGRDDVELLYICDADEKIGRNRQREIEGRTGKQPQFVKDMRAVFDDPAVHAISTATPNHWHSLASIWAMQAGKDVYVEKPVSHNVWEGRQCVNAARSLGRICQCGTQSRSSQSLHEAAGWVQEGHLGAIQYAIGTCYKPRPGIGRLNEPLKIPDEIDYDLWCGPAAMVPLYRPKLHYDWHWDFNTGNGDLGNQGIHQMDIARWFLGEAALSPRVVSFGGRLGYEDAGDTPNTQIVMHAYDKAPLIFEVRGLPKAKEFQQRGWGDNMDAFRGSQVGVIVQCEQGYVVIPSYSAAIAYSNDGEQIKRWSGGGDHYANFLKACRSRNHADLNADILDGHLSSALCHTGNISYQMGQKATAREISDTLSAMPLLAESFDRMVAHLRANDVPVDEPVLTQGAALSMDPASETFPGNAEASSRTTRQYRAPFIVPTIEV